MHFFSALPPTIERNPALAVPELLSIYRERKERHAKTTPGKDICLTDWNRNVLDLHELRQLLVTLGVPSSELAEDQPSSSSVAVTLS